MDTKRSPRFSLIALAILAKTITFSNAIFHGSHRNPAENPGFASKVDDRGAPPGDETEIVFLSVENDPSRSYHPESRIVGGAPSAPGRYPFYGHSTGGKLCGGTFVHEDILLTAAHCLESFPEDVLVGSINLYGNDGAERIPVELVFPHPNYNNETQENDIMLVKLVRPSSAEIVRWNDDELLPVDDETVTVIGFGMTSENGDVSQELLEVEVDVINWETCVQLLRVRMFQSTQICAGVLEGGKDSCAGDSGGPLLGPDLTQYGIVSYGIGCAAPDRPAVYTRVSAYTDWIRSGICIFAASPPSGCERSETIMPTSTAEGTEEPDIATNSPTVAPSVPTDFDSPTTASPSATIPESPTTPVQSPAETAQPSIEAVVEATDTPVLDSETSFPTSAVHSGTSTPSVMILPGITPTPSISVDPEPSLYPVLHPTFANEEYPNAHVYWPSVEKGVKTSKGKGSKKGHYYDQSSKGKGKGMTKSKSKGKGKGKGSSEESGKGKGNWGQDIEGKGKGTTYGKGKGKGELDGKGKGNISGKGKGNALGKGKGLGMDVGKGASVGKGKAIGWRFLASSLRVDGNIESDNTNGRLEKRHLRRS